MAGDHWRRHSNLQSFLNHTTPLVQSHTLPKSHFRDLNAAWQPPDTHMVEYFTLRDLWSQYYEWSVCGLGVPILLENDETVVQYYVPYLSAIQLYTSKSLAGPRCMGGDSETDSWSDDSESEKHSKSWDGVSSEDSGFDQDASCPPRGRIGHLYMQYIERSGPYERIPLVNKVHELAQSYPGLTSFKSADLSPASWMSVAWYPIGHIPARRTVKGLSACFLTFHTLSSSFLDNLPSNIENSMCCPNAKSMRSSKETKSSISLSPFGLATYKLQGNVWMNLETFDHDTLFNLYRVADCWLKQLRVQHHDFSFFVSHSM